MDKEQLEEMLERHEERDLQSTCNKLAADCISRLEAIECLNGEMKLSSFENAQIVQDYLVRAVEKLYDLPSAKPEILACGEGELVIPEQRWIPCTERLPEEDGRYLTTNGQGWYEVVSYAHGYGDLDAMYELPQDGGGWYIYDSEWGYCVYSSVVAWMPIEPWKGERE